MYYQKLYPIIDKKNLSKYIYSFKIQCSELSKQAQAGQFVHIKIDGYFLRRPISICSIDKKEETITIVFEIRGKGTDKFANFNKGDLIDVMGPLGKGFTLKEKNSKAVIIGGGIGVPPMVEVGKFYGENASCIIGFRSSENVILEQDFIANKNKTFVCTDDGTKGHKGFVTDKFKELIDKEKPNIVYACGPNVMLKKIVEICKKQNIPCEVSLEQRMGCGVGACLVCACKTVKNGEEYFAHVCKDGPVFNGKEVLFDE